MGHSIRVTHGTGRHVARHLRWIGAVSALLLFMAAPVSAQGLMDRLKGAAKRVSAASAELLLASGTSVDVEGLGLTTVQIGALTFGVAGLDLKDTTAVRVRAYLYNPTEAEVRTPLLSAASLTLVDSKGRRIESLAPPKVRGLARGATEIVVAPLERVEITLLFGQSRSDAGGAVLKVGPSGMIRGLPLTVGITEAEAPPDDSLPPPRSSPPSPSPTATAGAELRTPWTNARTNTYHGDTGE